MPISAWFQRQWHFAPEDSVEAAEDLECKVLNSIISNRDISQVDTSLRSL
jgi:hypothetical protein